MPERDPLREMVEWVGGSVGKEKSDEGQRMKDGEGGMNTSGSW